MVTHDPYGTDLRLTFGRRGEEADLAVGMQDLETVSGIDNLLQALALRLLVDRGELGGLGHPRYGSRIRDLLGEPLDRPNLELMRRYVRQTLMQDPRVAEVVSVSVQAAGTRRDSVEVLAQVLAGDGEMAQLEVTFDAA
ncbi:hypothetical protein GCM10007860_33620 [Chitiniphilus shinanonensis]|uniref:DUF2634 domain-containing protein n=1 Tax=Chitiniphilus shinanonensis TaxID=553088 RepID=A0ABQ6BXQ4_9NEIS|nr:hypothetical protein [Chitiniphilus shinanonensis]GLS06192.1 hypothetical protein GCM10007860_33620 [Chitiniphilus shinanonensis]